MVNPAKYPGANGSNTSSASEQRFSAAQLGRRFYTEHVVRRRSTDVVHLVTKETLLP